MIHDDEAALLERVETALEDAAERHRHELIVKIQTTSRSLSRFKLISMTRSWKDTEGRRIHIETDRLWVEMQQLCREFQNLYNLQFGHLPTVHATSS